MIRKVVQPIEIVEEPQTFERRAFVRYPRRMESFWQMLGVHSADLTSADTFDLSMTGVGITVENEFPANAILVLRLPTATQGWNTHLVRVKHSKRQDDGRFQIGCAFVRPLSIVQFQALLS